MREVKWLPGVCSCVILQDRYAPQDDYQFTVKCETHANLSDADARAAIIVLQSESQGE